MKRTAKLVRVLNFPWQIFMFEIEVKLLQVYTNLLDNCDNLFSSDHQDCERAYEILLVRLTG